MGYKMFMFWWLYVIAYAHLLLIWIYTYFQTPLKKVPGPWYTRFTHWPLKFAVVTGRRIFFIDRLHKKYGPIVRISPYEVAIADTNSFKEIHKMGTRFLKSPWYEQLANFPKPGLFTMRNPAEHGPRRRLLSKSFTRAYLVENWESVVRDKTRLWVDMIREDLCYNGVADVFNWSMLLASDLSAHVAFGQDFGSLLRGEANDFIRALKKLTMGSGIMVEFPLLRLLRFIPTQAIQEMFNGNEYILKQATEAVAMARSRKGEHNIFATIIEESEKEGGVHLDDIDVAIEAMNIIIAGTDTTAVTLTYLIWAVTRHPGWQITLERELERLPAQFTEDHLIRLPFLNAVIDEALRLYGAAPGSLPRVVPPDGALLNGFYLPQGVTVSTQQYTFCRDPEIYGDPFYFDPTRWLYPRRYEGKGERMETQTPSAKLAFHPFGAGSRACIGLHLARMELRYATATFFRDCRGIALHERANLKNMCPVNFFLIAPKAHKCEIIPAPGDRKTEIPVCLWRKLGLL